MQQADDIITFWFDACAPSDWWKKSEAFDTLIRDRFLETYDAVRAAPKPLWVQSAESRLAEVIVLDQFPRNMFRGTSRMFEADMRALDCAEQAVEAGADKLLEGPKKAFLYMPFMHSEDADIQKRSLTVFNQPGLEDHYEFAVKHKVIIDRFGRYPHRNAVLGHKNRPEEDVFLQDPASGF